MNDNSRYASVSTTEMQMAGGRTVVYFRRRWIPQPESFSIIQTVRVKESDRLDNLTYAHLGDAELFWLLCDANRALKPEELETEGRVLGIPLPAGVPAPLDDEP